jgi:hypothetical protein
VAVGDVNGDGLDDLVSSDTTSVPGDVSIELGDGAGGFAATLVQDARGAPAQLALADVNGDLRADVITADGGMQSVSVLLGNADGTIGPLRSFPVGGNTDGLAVGNFNADGNPDIAVGHMSRVVTVLLGDGRGGFPTQNDFETLFVQQFALATADFDADGRVDLAASGSGFNILRGTGTGAFESATAHGFGALALAVGDLNNDTAPDVVGTQGGNVFVRLNTSSAGPRPLPQPTVAETANVQPVKGTVLVKQPGSGRFLRLKQGDQIPVGSLVDTTRGSVGVTSAAGGGRVQSAVFRAGLFRLGQTRGPKPITEVRLASPLHCGAAGHKGATKRPLLRRLFGRGHGRFRTRGRHSIASIRGTEWLVKDTCASTTTVSLHGTVVVNDLLKHRTVTLRTGQRYIARRGNR